MIKIPAREKAQFRAAFDDLVADLDEAPAFDHPWAMESYALSAVPLMPHPDMHPDLAQMQVDAYLARGDALAAGMLTALARLAHDPVGARAREAATELARRGVKSPLDDEIGALRAQECTIFELEGQLAAIGLVLQRSSAPRVAQGALILIDRDEGYPSLRDVEVWDPLPVGVVKRRLTVDVEGGTHRPATVAHVLELVAAGMEAEEPLVDEHLLDLAIVERALTGRDIHLPWPPAYPAEEVEEEGFAGRLVTQMQAEGVDPTDPDALAAWMDDFNSRSFEERVAITGPSPRPPAQKAKAQRRQAKAARKRNRRR